MKVKQRTKISFSVDCTLSEIEARALGALVGYGTDEFLAAFYKHMGKAYLEPHEAGLRSLFAKIKSDVVPALCHVDTARRALRSVKL